MCVHHFHNKERGYPHFSNFLGLSPLLISKNKPRGLFILTYINSHFTGLQTVFIQIMGIAWFLAQKWYLWQLQSYLRDSIDAHCLKSIAGWKSTVARSTAHRLKSVMLWFLITEQIPISLALYSLRDCDALPKPSLSSPPILRSFFKIWSVILSNFTFVQ